MKSITHIAKECNVGYYQVKSIVRKEQFIPCYVKGKIKYYNKYQEHAIIDLLSITYMIGKPIFHIYESKMNLKSFKCDWHQENFLEHKRKTYNKKL